MTSFSHSWNIPVEQDPSFNMLRLQPMGSGFHPQWYRKLTRHTEGDNFTLKMCPSTQNFLNNGYLVRNPFDIEVGLDPSGEMYVKTEKDGVHLSIHPNQQFGSDYPFQEGFSKFSLKFQAMFEVLFDEPTVIMYLPCWWHEQHNNIRALHGIMNAAEENHPYNYSVNTLLRIPSEKYIIPAGTPVAHIFFIHIKNMSVGEDVSNPSGRKAYEEANKDLFSKDYLNYLRQFQVENK